MDSAITPATPRPNAGQRRGIKAAVKVLGPGTDVRAYAAGRAQPRMTTGAIIMVLVFLTVFAVALANGIVVMPGVVFAFLFYATICPMRAIAVTSTDVVLMRTSWYNGKPDAVLARGDFSVLNASGTGSTVRLHAGPDIVKLRRSAHAQLVAAAVPPMP